MRQFVLAAAVSSALAGCGEATTPWHTSITASVEDVVDGVPVGALQAHVLLRNLGRDEAWFTGCPTPPRGTLEEFSGQSWQTVATINRCAAFGHPERARVAPGGGLSFLVDAPHAGTFRLRVSYGPHADGEGLAITTPPFPVP
jgi:hypothetical protein